MITIHADLPDDRRAQAAAVLWDAFHEKLGVALGDAERGTRFLAETLDPATVLWAELDGAVAGVLVLGGLPHPAPGGNLRALWHIYGLSALPRLALLALMESEVPSDGLLIDSVAVAASARGRGVGTALLDAAHARAAALGKACVELEVIDANPAAKSLYTRLGYVDVKHARIPWPLSKLLHIKGTTRMRLAVS